MFSKEVTPHGPLDSFSMGAGHQKCKSISSLGIFRFLDLTLCTLHLSVHLYPLSHHFLHNRLLNISKCFPGFCELFWQMIKPKEGVMETPVYSLSFRSSRDTLGLQLLSEVGVGSHPVGLSPESLGSKAFSRWIVSELS